MAPDAIVKDVGDIRRQRPNPDTRPTSYGGTSYHDRFVPWMSEFPVAMEDRWFPGPTSHPYPGVSSCRTDAPGTSSSNTALRSHDSMAVARTFGSSW